MQVAAMVAMPMPPMLGFTRMAFQTSLVSNIRPRTWNALLSILVPIVILLMDAVSTSNDFFPHSSNGSFSSPFPSCFSLVAVANYPKITLSEFGSAYGDEAIMSEIYARGPVAANINAECIETYTGGIAPYDNCKPNLNNHVIQLNGWGTENGTDYWIGRNSWGTYWGELWFLFENTNRF
jgi:hypothetical protein